MSGVIALLGSSLIAMASPTAPALAASTLLPPSPSPAVSPPLTAPVVSRSAPAPWMPSAGPVKQHRTARLCSTVIEPGRARCFAIGQTDTVQPAGVRANAVSPYVTPAGFGPSSLAAAYKLDQAKGSGRTVAIVNAYDNPRAEADLATYRAQYGLPACTTANGCFKKVNQSGSTTGLPPFNEGWAAEISLDLDMVSATCPNCHILLVEARTNDLSDLGTAVNTAAHTAGVVAISNSYGGSDADDTNLGPYYSHPGIAVTASTGDDGYLVAYPASSSHVTAVGGTTLRTAANTRGWTETAWSKAGSGCSRFNPALPVAGSFNTGCGKRAMADVSAVGDPNTGVAVFNSGWQVYGGTSVSSPIIASLYALAGAPGPTDIPNTYPYTRSSSLNDVTSGSNGTCSPSSWCTAGIGWDGPTGLGTPNGTGAFGGVKITNPGAQASPTGAPLTLQIRVTGAGSASQLSYVASGLPPGLTIDPRTGLISGTPSTQGRYTVTATVTATTTDGIFASAPATVEWVIQTEGTFVSLAPARLLDTRQGTGAPKAAVAPRGTVLLQVVGRGGVPASGVSAVALNVTATAPTSAGFIIVYGGGNSRPDASNLNYMKGQTVPNLVIAPVGAGGKVALYNGSSGTIQLVADVSGYYLAGTPTAAGTFGSLAPSRLLDTRSGVGASQAAVPAGGTVALQVTGSGGVPTSGVSAVVLNVTVTAPAGPGFVTAYGEGTSLPGASNLNFVAGQTVPNLVIVPVGAKGKVALYNGSAGTVQLVADVSGYYLAGTPTAAGAYGSLDPSRLLDTREGTGAAKAAVARQATVHLQVDGRGGVPASAVSAVVLNVTVTAPAGAGFVTAYGDGTPLPGASNLNFVAGQTVPNLVIAPVGANGKVALYNGSPGTTQLVADVSGYFLAYP